MGGTVTFLCPSALYNFCYQAGVTLFVLSFINYYGVECLFINLQGQVRCSKCRHIGWGCADLSLTESAGWFRWNQWQLKSGADWTTILVGPYPNETSKQANGWHHDVLYETHCHITLWKQYAAKTEFCPQHLTCIEYILTAYHSSIIK